MQDENNILKRRILVLIRNKHEITNIALSTMDFTCQA